MGDVTAVEVLFTIPFPIKPEQIPVTIAELSDKIRDFEEVIEFYRRGIEAVQSQCYHQSKTQDSDGGWNCKICGKIGVF